MSYTKPHHTIIQSIRAYSIAKRRLVWKRIQKLSFATWKPVMIVKGSAY
jgi:hypothetical protein